MSCRYHLALDVRPKRKDAPQRPPRITFNLPEDPALWPADAPTCALHAADEGPHTLDQLGGILGDVSRERSRQIGSRALARLAEYGIIHDLAEDLDLDTSTRAPAHKRPSAEAKGHHGPRTPSTDPDLDGTYSGPFRSQTMTAKMRKIQAESIAPVKTISPDAVDLVALTADIDRKRNGKPAPTGPRKSNVALDTFTQMTTDPRASERYARSRESLQSYRRLTAPDAPAKATTTTQPRPPSPPSPPPIELPPATTHAEATPEAPALVQSDDQPEVAVVYALPVDPPPTPPSLPQQPMTRPDMRTRRSVYEDANETAKRNLAKIMAARGLTRESLSALARDAHTAHTPMSVDQAIVRAMNGTASPVSVWYRRIASLLGVPLSDLCSDPAWLAAVAPEDSPVASPHSHLHRPPAPPDTPPPSPQHSPDTPPPSPQHSPDTPPPSPQHSPDTPPALPLPTREDALAPLILDLLTKSQAQDKRVNELSAVVGILRAEISDLQQQLAAATKERDAATTTLARIKAAL